MDPLNPAWLQGIDLSELNAPLDLPRLLASPPGFAFVRSAEGKDKDSAFDATWKAFWQAGVPCGPYAYFRPRHDARMLADALLGPLGDDVPLLPPVIDAEELDGQSRERFLGVLQEMVDLVQQALGLRPLVYTGPAFWADQVGGSSAVSACPLWLADYRSEPHVPPGWTDWTFWQWSGTGHWPGVPRYVDRSVFRGSPGDLASVAWP